MTKNRSEDEHKSCNTGDTTGFHCMEILGGYGLDQKKYYDWTEKIYIRHNRKKRREWKLACREAMYKTGIQAWILPAAMSQCS